MVLDECCVDRVINFGYLKTGGVIEAPKPRCCSDSHQILRGFILNILDDGKAHAACARLALNTEMVRPLLSKQLQILASCHALEKKNLSCFV